MRLRSVVVASLVAVVLGSALAAQQSASSLIDKAWRKFGAINDYSADIRLDMKGEAVSIKGMTMKFYYKKPGKTRVIAQQGFAALPKNLALGNPLKDLAKHARATLLRTEKKNGAECYVIQLDPVTASPDSQSMLMWLDKSRLLILATSGLGQHKLDSTWTYTKVDKKYDLPCKIVATIDIPGRDGARPAKAVVTFSNYRVNKGIDDSVFKETGAKTR